MYSKPTVSEFTTDFPAYGRPEYADLIQDTIDQAWVLYGDPILDLPEEKQKMAFRFAVCHVFEEECWVQTGLAGAPNEAKSRNDSYVFKGNMRGLYGTKCGRQLQALFFAQSGRVYASEIESGCQSRYGCGC
jgi:hypothetical protein